MLNVTPIKSSPAEFQNYLQSQIEVDDYYTQSGQGHGTWLQGNNNVQKGEISRIVSNLPQSRVGPRKPAWDLTFSAPKDFSIVYAAASPEMREVLKNIQLNSVREALIYATKNGSIVTRHGAGGNETRPVEFDQLKTAAFFHTTSRAGDPNIHTHVILINNHCGRAIDVDTRFATAADALYLSILSQKIQALGFSTKRSNSHKAFNIVSVPDALREEFSKRANQCAAFHQGDDRKKKIAGIATRPDKAKIEQAELDKTWKAEIEKHGFSIEKALTASNDSTSAQISIEKILETATQNESVIQPHKLDEIAFYESQFSTQFHPLDTASRTREAAVQLQNREGKTAFTTTEMIEIEQKIMDWGKTAITQPAPGPNRDDVEKLAEQAGLIYEQKQMLMHVCSPGRLALVEGDAGTGKSFTLGVARAAWEGAGMKVLGVAPSGKAAQGLADGAGIQSTTIHAALQIIENARELNQPPPIDKNTVLVVDEGGMVGSRLLEKIVNEVERAEAKLVIVGDSKQLQPVDAGGMFKKLAADLGASRLSTIYRQTIESDKEIVRAFRDGKAPQGLEALDKKGNLHVHNLNQLKNEMIEKWADVIDPKNMSETILLAGKRYDVTTLNRLARQKMKDMNLISSDEYHLGGEAYSTGDRIIFLKNNKKLAVANGQLGTIQGISERKGSHLVTVKMDNNKTVSFDTRDYQNFQHGYAITTHKSQGVTCQNTLLLASEMTTREWTYVATSRSKSAPHVFLPGDPGDKIQAIRHAGSKMEISKPKTTTLDWNVVPQAQMQHQRHQTAQAQAGGQAGGQGNQPNPGRTATAGTAGLGELLSNNKGSDDLIREAGKAAQDAEIAVSALGLKDPIAIKIARKAYHQGQSQNQSIGLEF